MLVLQLNHIDDVIYINIPPSTEPQQVSITLVRGGLVRLGFDAPKQIAICRVNAIVKEPPPHRLNPPDSYVPRSSHHNRKQQP